MLMVGHQHRFRRNPIAAKLLLDRGVIGRWRPWWRLNRTGRGG
jgi:predicted dehydrogenase